PSLVPLRLWPEISGPLQTLQWVDGTKKIDLVRMLLRLTGEDSDREKRLAKIWVRDKYKPWIECIRTAMPDDGPLTDAIDRLDNAVEKARQNSSVKRNSCLQTVVRGSLDGLALALENVEGGYEIPAVHYPHYLLALQKNLGVKVKAIALVGKQEHFWALNLGESIGKSAHPESKRLFV